VISTALHSARTDAHFCSSTCHDKAHGSFLALETSPAAAVHFAELDNYCREHGERFPLLAARFTLMQLQQVLADGGSSNGSSSSDGSRSSGSSSSGSDGSSSPLGDLSFLCFANVTHPLPQPWQESYQLLRSGIDALVADAGERGARGSSSGSSSSDKFESAADALDMDW